MKKQWLLVAIATSVSAAISFAQQTGLAGVPGAAAAGPGTVTSFSFPATLGGLFACSVTNPTTTPAVSCTVTNTFANTVYGNFSGSGGIPGFSNAPVFSAAKLTNFPTLNQNTTGTAAGLSAASALPSGTTASTQSIGDNSTKVATDAFVLANSGGSGSGTVTSFSFPTALGGLFACSVTNASTTPAVNCTVANTSANSVYGNFSGSAGSPGFSNAPVFSAAGLTNFPTLNQSTTGTAAGLSVASALPSGTTATTQSIGDNSTKVATDAFVLANSGGSGGGSGTVSSGPQYAIPGYTTSGTGTTVGPSNITVDSTGNNLTVPGILLSPTANRQFYDGGWTYPCTYSSVTYYTEPDCAFYGVLNWITTNNVSGATLNFGSGVINKCAEWIGNVQSSSSPYQISLRGAGGEGSTTIEQINGSVTGGHSCLLGANPMILYPPASGGEGSRYDITDLELHANNAAASVLDALAANYEGRVVNVLGYCAINGLEDHCMQLSGPSASPQNEWWFQDQVAVTLEPQYYQFGNGATVSTSVSGGAVTFTVTNGGTGYTNPYLYVDGYGKGASPCTSITPPTLTQSGGVVQSISGTYGSGCVGPIYAYVIDGPGNNYLMKMPYFTDSKPSSLVLEGGARIADLYLQGGNNTFSGIHFSAGNIAEEPPYGAIFPNEGVGLGHFYGTNCGEVLQYCYYMLASAHITDSQFFSQFPVAGLSYAYVQGTNETDLDGLICSGTQTLGDWHSIVTLYGPIDTFAGSQLTSGNNSTFTAEKVNNCNASVAGTAVATNVPTAGNEFNLFSQANSTWVDLGTWLFNGSSPQISYGSLNVTITSSLNGAAAVRTHITALPGTNAAAPNLSGGLLIQDDASIGNDTVLAAALVDTTGSGSTSNNSFDLYVDLAAHTTGTYSVSHGQYDSWTAIQGTKSNPGGASSTVYPLTLTHSFSDATALPLAAGVTATTQNTSPCDNSTKVATDYFVTACGSGGGGAIGYSGTPSLSTTATYASANGTTTATTTAGAGWPAPSPSPIASLHVSVATTPATTLVVTLYDGSTAEAVTCTITNPGTTCNDTTHTFTPAIGDLLTWQITLGSSTLSANTLISANWATPPAALFGGNPWGGTATGSFNTLAISLSPPPQSLSALSGIVLGFIPNLANTTSTPTLNVQGLGAVTIVKGTNTALNNGDLATGTIAYVAYNGTNFVLQNPQNAITQASADASSFANPNFKTGYINSSSGSTGNVSYQGGQDAGISSALGSAIVRGGTNSGTGAGGNTNIEAGANTSTGQQGFANVQQSFTIAAATTIGYVMGMTTAADRVQAAAPGSTNNVGVAASAGGTGTQLYVATDGKILTAFDGTPTVGDIACAPPASTGTAGLAHDNGATACPAGQKLGVVTGQVSGTGPGATATVLLQLGS